MVQGGLFLAVLEELKDHQSLINYFHHQEFVSTFFLNLIFLFLLTNIIFISQSTC
jgi:hypothetical protein